MSKFVDENLKLRNENMDLMRKLMEKMEEENAKCKENIELKAKLSELEGQIAELKEKNAELKDQHTKSMNEIAELKAEKLLQDQRMSNNTKMSKMLNKIEEMKLKEMELKEKLDKKIAKMEQKKEMKITELKSQMIKLSDSKRVLMNQFEELSAAEREKHSEPAVTIESMQQRKRAADEESDSTTATKKSKYSEKESKSKSINPHQKPATISVTTKKTATTTNAINSNGSKRIRKEAPKEEKKNSEKKISETATKGGYTGFDIEQLFSDPKGGDSSNIVPTVDEHGEGDANNASKENTPKISRGMQQDSEPAPTFFASKTSTRLAFDLHKAETERREFLAKSRGQQQSIQQKETHGADNFVKRQGELGNKRTEQDQYREIKQEIDIKIKQRDKELEEQRGSLKFREN